MDQQDPRDAADPMRALVELIFLAARSRSCAFSLSSISLARVDLYSTFTLEDKKHAIEGYKLMRLAWDPVGTEFASWHMQCEVFYNRASHVTLNRMEQVGDYDDLVSGRKSDDAGDGRRRCQ